MQQFAQKHSRLRAAMKSGWTNVFQAARPRRRAVPQLVVAAAPAVDPVVLTMLAVNRLGPATMRTVINGRALTVAVPDVRIAEIFRAALTEMQKIRRTDRLVDVVVSAETK